MKLKDAGYIGKNSWLILKNEFNHFWRMIKLEVDVDRIYEDFTPSYLRHKPISRQGQKSESKSICEYLTIWQVSYFWNINFWQCLEHIFKKEYIISLFQYVNFYDRNVLEFLYIYQKPLHYLKFFEWQNRNKHWRRCGTADLKSVWTQHSQGYHVSLLLDVLWEKPLCRPVSPLVGTPR